MKHVFDLCSVRIALSIIKESLFPVFRPSPIFYEYRLILLLYFIKSYILTNLYRSEE